MTKTVDTARSAPPRLGSSITNRDSPPLWWAVIQLTALSFHLPLTVLTGNQSAIASRESVLLIGGAVTIISMTLYLLLGFSVMPKWRALALVSVTIIYFWHWSGSVGGGLLSGPIPAIAIYVLVAAAAVKFAQRHFFKVAAFAISVALAGTLGLLAIVDTLKAPAASVGVQNPVEAAQFTQTPDIVLIVLDGYGRADVIDSVYGHDNGPFLDGLVDEGFDVAQESIANYSITHLSIPALLNMSYMHPDGAVIGNNDLHYLADQISGGNDLVEMLKANGYSYVHAESDHWYNACGDNVDICLPGPKPDITGHALLVRTPIGGLFYRDTGDPTTALNRTRVDQLTHWDETTSEWPDGPVFAFFHVQLPHPPLYMDSECEVRVDPELGGRIMNNGEMSPEQLERRKEAWVEQVECANATIESFVDQLDDDTVVVLVSDHGPDLNFMLESNPADLDPEGLAERFPSLTAVRLPDECRGNLPDDVDTVNTFRVLTNCLTGQTAETLPTRNFIAGFGGPIVELKLDRQNAED